MPDSVPLQIPKVSMAAEEVEFVEWLVEDGASVAEGDPIYSVATDKVESEIESPASGTLRRGEAEAEESYDVGTEIGRIDTQ